MMEMTTVQAEKKVAFSFKEVLVRNSVFNHVFCIEVDGKLYEVFVTKDERFVIQNGMIEPEKALQQLLAINRARL